ncbi:MAG: Ldh family oxidoreductase [Candidatus Methanomethylicia archaeon]|nr:Ldh family oxidoreductase [Candidatus Methanomethylicia archaeon]
MELYEREPPIPFEEYLRVDPFELKNFVSNIYQSLGVYEFDADIVADVLVTADLFGISSHGVQRVSRYVGGIKCGNINVKPNMRFHGRGAVGVIDGDKGFGQVIGVKAMEIALEKTKDYGIGVVLAKNSNHYGIAGYYALKAVDHGYIGFSSTNSDKLVSYINTIGKSIGTNPIAIAVPTLNPPPILFDAATSIIPVGKIEIYSKLKRELPSGYVIDLDGNILFGDAKKILDLLKNDKASILPLGGLSEEFGGHKGSGLAFIIDILCGVLSGAAWGIHIGYTIGDKPANVGHAFMVWDIESFIPKQEFLSRIEQYKSEIKSLKKHPNADAIWIPGEKAWKTMQTRLKIGIPIHISVYSELNKIASEVGLNRELKILFKR